MATTPPNTESEGEKTTKPKSTKSKKTTPRPKNIDGVVKPKKSSKKKEEVIVLAPAEDLDEVAIEEIKEDVAEESPKSSPENIEITVIDYTDPEENSVEDTKENLPEEVSKSPQDETETEEESIAEEIVESAPITDGSVEEPSEDDQDLDALIEGFADAEEEEVVEEAISDEKEEQPKKIKKAPRRALPFRILSRILAFATTGILTALIIRVTLTNMIPLKYIIIAGVVAGLFSLFYLFKSFRKKTHISMLIFLNLIGIALSIAGVFGFLKIDETMRFLNQNLGEEKEYSIYNVIVSSKSDYNSLDDVKGQVFHSISDFVDTEKLESAVKEQADSTIAYEDGITSLLKNSMEDTKYISVLNSGTYEATLEADKDDKYSNNLKIIGEIKVEVEKAKLGSNSNLTEESFVVYLSGIDTRSGMMVDRSLSDVNLVIAVNPKTKNILMVAVPRDYYIQLHGTSGLPDKLTHAGSLGGLDLSMATIEDLLEIKFNQYIRVNFNFVINLVDAIGGITVNSDVNYNIVAHTNHSCVFYPGQNNLDGACALAFARERYSYETGDRHRGENQEQVIQKIFEKVTSSSTLIGRYSEILDALSGSFDTSISTQDITSLVNMQLSDMAKWTINSYNLDGTTGSAYTYSYPSQQLSVMFPDESTVITARKKLDAVLEGKEETDSENLEEAVESEIEASER